MKAKPYNPKKIVSRAGKTDKQPAVANKVNGSKGTSDLKSFMKQMRMNKMHQDTVENEDQIYVNGPAVMQ